jgi:hypothetical protein
MIKSLAIYLTFSLYIPTDLGIITIICEKQAELNIGIIA